MILLIDNYDSFTYNLVQRIGELDPAIDLKVFRNDKITVEEAATLKPDHLIISPGPCTPKEAGVSCDMIQAFAGKVPVLGVCLGHQSMGHTYGMNVIRNERLMHGKTSPIFHDGKGIFEGLGNPFIATRYHSLVIEPGSFDHDRFEVTAWTQKDESQKNENDVWEIMGLRAKPGAFDGVDANSQQPLEGLQFHPESFLTSEGPLMFANFLGLPRPQPLELPEMPEVF